MTDTDGDDRMNIEELFKSDKEDVFRGFFSYFSYDGSLTAPPCDEYVTWYIADPPIEVGFTLLQMFADPVLHAPAKSCHLKSGSPNPEGNNRSI